MRLLPQSKFTITTKYSVARIQELMTTIFDDAENLYTNELRVFIKNIDKKKHTVTYNDTSITMVFGYDKTNRLFFGKDDFKDSYKIVVDGEMSEEGDYTKILFEITPPKIFHIFYFVVCILLILSLPILIYFGEMRLVSLFNLFFPMFYLGFYLSHVSYVRGIKNFLINTLK